MEVRKPKKRAFFDNPYKFSFKDFIALIFIAMFVYVTIRSIVDKEVLDVMNALIPPVMTVLGGYFGQEIASAYFMSKNPNQYMYGNYGMYGGYGTYGGYQQPGTTTTQTAEEQAEENQIQSPYDGQY